MIRATSKFLDWKATKLLLLCFVYGLFFCLNSFASFSNSFLSSNLGAVASNSLYNSQELDNDDPEGAIEVPHLDSWCSEEGLYTTKGMKSGDDNISCAKGMKSENDVWFKFQATSSLIEIAAIPFGKDPISKHSLVLYDQNLLEMACGAAGKDDMPAKVAYTDLVQEEWYFIRIDNEDKKEGSFTLCVSNVISNDFQVGAIDIQYEQQWCSGPNRFSLSGMSAAGEPFFCEKEKDPKRDAWFRFQATDTELELHVLPDGEFGIKKHRVALYDASSSQVACGTQAGKEGPAKLATTGLIVGEWYYVRVDSDDKKKLDFELCLTTSISHDFREGAIELAHNEDNCSEGGIYTTTGMTPQGEAMECGKEKDAQNDVWFSFVATTEVH